MSRGGTILAKLTRSWRRHPRSRTISESTVLAAAGRRRSWRGGPGLSRAGISAIETDRLVPSAAAALALAEALECRVEDLFRLRRQAPSDPVWAWPSGRESCRYWAAEVEGVERLYPAEPTAIGMIPHDGVIHPGAPRESSRRRPEADAGDGLLRPGRRAAGRRAGRHGRRPSPGLAKAQPGGSRVAGARDWCTPPAFTSAGPSEPGGNGMVVRGKLGAGYSLLRIARWEEGIALAPERGVRSIRAAVHSEPAVDRPGRGVRSAAMP